MPSGLKFSYNKSPRISSYKILNERKNSVVCNSMEEAEPPPASTQQPAEQPLPPQQSQQPAQLQPSSSNSPLPLPTTLSSSPQSSPNPNPTFRPQTSQPQPEQQSPTSQSSQTRPPFNRPWQQPSALTQSSSSSHLSSTLPVPPFSSPASSSVSAPSVQRGGMAIGVPAHHTSPPLPPTSFSSLNQPSFSQQFGRNPANVPDSVSSATNQSQVRQPIQGMGMMGSLSSSSPLRPAGGPAHHHLRPVGSPLRPPSSSISQLPASQGHGMLRASSVGSPTSPSPSPSTSQSMLPQNQPWLSQGKPPLPPLSIRPQLSSQSLAQRSHIPQSQQQHAMQTNTQQQQPSSVSQPTQPPTSHQQQEAFGQQLPASRVQQSLSQQQQITRAQGVGNLKTPSHSTIQPSASSLHRAAAVETSEFCNRVLGKRSIQELLSQVDPSEKLDPDVVDILMDIADEFVESTVTFGCSLAKHRKSPTLEAKDILLHLERNWNMNLPGFSGDEIKSYKKQLASDIHKERITAIKKSIVATETTNTKSSAGQAGGNAKGHPAKAPTNILGSPNPKARESG